MIRIGVGEGTNRCLVTFDQGDITVTCDEQIRESTKTMARVMQQIAGLAPTNKDPDYSAAKMMIEKLGGEIIEYRPPASKQGHA
jgi:hypothetical protein